MLNYFDMLFMPMVLLTGFIGYYVGMFIEAYLIAIVVGIMVMVNALFGMEKIRAYIVLFVSSILLSAVSVAYFGVFSGRFFAKPAVKLLNRICGAAIAVFVMLMICRTMLLPLSLHLPESAHAAVVNSFTMTAVVPLVQDVLPGMQAELWQAANNFITSVIPQPSPAAEKNKTGTDQKKDRKTEKKKAAPSRRQAASDTAADAESGADVDAADSDAE
jgi:hypothetical protein